MSTPNVELRCPYWPRTKFAEAIEADGGLEVTCRACRRAADNADDLPVLVIHRFDLHTGECIDTREVARQTS